MKKQNFLIIAIFLSVIIFTACSGNTEAKDVTLKTQEDSLNYALGVINGAEIKTSHFHTDVSDVSLEKFIKALDNAYKSKKGNEVFDYGKQIGNKLRQQKDSGLDFDSTIVFNSDLVLQGIFNGLKGFKEGISPDNANMYYQLTKLKRKQNSNPLPSQIPLPSSNQTDSTSNQTDSLR